MDTEFTVIHTRTPAEWTTWDCANVTVTDEGVRLSSDPTPRYVTPRPVGGQSLATAGPIDVDVDPCGARYVLGADGGLYRAAPNAASFDRVECDPLDDREATPRALCVAGKTLYVVGTRPAGADRRAGGERDPDRDDTGSADRHGYVQALSARLRQVRWVVDSVESADDVRFTDPIRVVTGRASQTVYVLDRGPKPGSGFVARVHEDGTSRVVVRGLWRPLDLAVGRDEADDRDEAIVVLDADEAETRLWWVSDDRSRDADDGDGGGEHDAGQPPVAVDERTTENHPLSFPGATCVEIVGSDEVVVGVDPKAVDERAASAEENVSTERTLYSYRRADRSFERVSSFKRGCTRLRRVTDVDVNPGLYVIATDDETHSRDVCVLDPTPAIAPLETASPCPTDRAPEYAGWLQTRFDIGSLGADWYRLAVGVGSKPPGTRVVLSYATTDGAEPMEGDDEESERNDRGDTAQVVDCRTGDEGEPENGDDDEDDEYWTPVGGPNPTDALVPTNGRRFLWLKLELVGDRYTSPVVRSLKVSVTLESYLRYLPAIYREDQVSAQFLARFLSVFEDTYGDIDHGIGTLTRYLDADVIPAPHLSWLGSWLAVADDEAWSERSKRTLIREAPRLFKQRGTRPGLVRLLDIYLSGVPEAPVPWTVTDDETETQNDEGDGTGGNGDDENGDDDHRDGCAYDGGEDGPYAHHVSILEYWDVVPPAGERDRDDEASIDVGGAGSSEGERGRARSPLECLVSCPQEFVVLLGPTVGEDAQATVERIVETERPAHTVGRTVGLGSWGRLDGHVYLGINSSLPPRAFVIGRSTLGTDTVLGRRESDSQLGQVSRLGAGIELY